MPLSDEVRNLLLKYIAGETNDEEVEWIESRLKDDAGVFEEFEQLWDLWHAVGAAAHINRFNVDKGWEELSKKQRQREEAHKGTRQLRKAVIKWGSAAAAVLLLLFALFLWRLQNKGIVVNEFPKNSVLNQQSRPDVKAHAIAHSFKAQTAPDGQKKIRLPDGSLIWLNGGTKVRYSINKKNNTRMLYLSGQAFFDIKQDANRPFIVKTDHASIKVLGTRFDVAAYPDEKITEAVLMGGSILFTTHKGSKEINTPVEPGQKISINYLSGQLKVMNVDTAFYTLWKEGKLLFRNESFGHVARAMEHKYGIQIIFKDQSLQKERLNGYLEKESLEEALEALKLTLQFQYAIKDGEVIIYR